MAQVIPYAPGARKATKPILDAHRKDLAALTRIIRRTPGAPLRVTPIGRPTLEMEILPPIVGITPPTDLLLITVVLLTVAGPILLRLITAIAVTPRHALTTLRRVLIPLRTATPLRTLRLRTTPRLIVLVAAVPIVAAVEAPTVVVAVTAEAAITN